MNRTDASSLNATLEAAANHIRATLHEVAGRVTDQLPTLAQSSGRIADRDLLLTAHTDLRRHLGAMNHVFGIELMNRIRQALSPDAGPRRPLQGADWETLTLVEDSEVEERMHSDRIAQQIAHACEAELRELSTYVGALLELGHADHERNPLRAEVLGGALFHAIESVSPETGVRKVLAQELGAGMARAMPDCYRQILAGLRQRGIKPAQLAVRQADATGHHVSGYQTTGQGTLNSDSGRGDDVSDSGAGDSRFLGQGSGGGQFGPSGRGRRVAGRNSGAGRDTGLGPSVGPRGGGRGGSGGGGHGLAIDAQMMNLLRRLTPGDTEVSALRERGYRRTVQGSHGETGAGDGLASGADAGTLEGLMAVNLIRAHREELIQASGGQLDHMVLDVVGGLFDQILSDSRVPPQMARQIARLQLPVLRVALEDASFFSSRRHPVRRFVNRIASLACAFDEFDDGPGKIFLDRVRDLVQQIVDGDFDQIDLYTQKLGELESFIAAQTHEEVERTGTAQTLGGKETEWRLQQRYMLQLQSSLTPLNLPAYLLSFLSQVWSQALVRAASQDGPESDRTRRYRRVGRDVVMSVQPKGSPAMRKKFLMQLPAMMRDLNEGLALIGWPDAAQREFFAQLLPAHAAALKAPAQTELDHNMMVKQLEAVFQIAIPGAEALSPSDPVPEVDAAEVTRQFTPEEVARVGLVTETAVDWNKAVDIDLGEAPDTVPEVPEPPSGQGQDESPGPASGPRLIEHLRIGFAYQMQLKDEWQKVRLTHISPGRAFFVFTRGHKHQETISMTARMLTRMCESGRLRAVENAYLMERATQRARSQLAALGRTTTL